MPTSPVRLGVSLAALCGIASAAVCASGAATLFAQTPAPITLAVDASDAPRRIFHVHESLPAKPGPITLAYPKWIPGEHGPTGPITDLVGLKITRGRTPRRVAPRADGDVELHRRRACRGAIRSSSPSTTSRR